MISEETVSSKKRKHACERDELRMGEMFKSGSGNLSRLLRATMPVTPPPRHYAYMF